MVPEKVSYNTFFYRVPYALLFPALPYTRLCSILSCPALLCPSMGSALLLGEPL
jgi:hypothetical protein